MPTSSIQSMNFPNLFLRHRNFLAELTEVHSDLDRLDSTFQQVTGLADGQAASFESMNFPDHFLRHQDFRLKLQKRPFDPERELFDRDSTFSIVPGFLGDGSVSFRSLNFPDRFIRHRNFSLFLDPPDPTFFNADASFRLVPPFAQEPTVTLRFRGLNCFGETDGELSGSDEIYLLTIVTTIQGDQITTRTEKHPIGFSVFESVDAGRSFGGPTSICYAGPARDLSLAVMLMENDQGDPNAFRTQIDAVVKAGSAVLASTTGIPLPEAAQQLLGQAVNAVFDSGDDLISQVPITLSAGELLDEARKPRVRERNVEFTFFTDHRGDGATYKAYFDVVQTTTG